MRLYDSQRLYGLARDNAPEARMELSGVMANLLEHELSGREQELVADVLITLVRHAEQDLRQALAERLAKMEQVPLRLILHLVNDEIQVARPILRDSPVLSDLDLVYIIKLRGPEYWQAIAARHNLSEHIIDTLAGTKEIGTALVLTRNDRVQLTPYALETLTGMASEAGELARPLLMREDMPPSMARRLYTHVGHELKNYIRAFYGVVPQDVEQAVEEVVVDFVDSAYESAPIAVPSDKDTMPSDELMAKLRHMSDIGQVNLSTIMDAVRKGDIAGFIGMFAVYTALMPEQIHGMMEQSAGRQLAILCRAFGMQKGDFSTIYLMTHRMRSSDRLVNHKDLLSALTYFDRIRPEAAREVLARSMSTATRH